MILCDQTSDFIIYFDKVCQSYCYYSKLYQFLFPLQMYLHHPLWLLPLVVGSGGSRKHSRKHKDYESYETQRHKYSQERHTEDTFEEYDYYDDDYLETQVQGDRGPMIHDTQQIPNRNKLLIIVLGG